METPTTSIYKDFAPLMKGAGIQYREKDHWLISYGKPETADKWILYISCCVHVVPGLVEAVLLVLKKWAVPFKLVRDQQTVESINNGDIDIKEVGRVFTIYPGDNAVSIAAELEAVTVKKFTGQGIPECRRIGNVVYGQFSKVVDPGLPRAKKVEEICIPPLSQTPFKIRRRYRPSSSLYRVFTVLRTLELPQKEIREHVKGTNFKGIHLGSFTPSLIKWGYAETACDMYGRTIWDRFRWQREALRDLYKSGVPVPKPRRLYRNRDGCGLSMRFIDGEELGDAVRRLLNGKKWKDAPAEVRAKIRGYYREALRIIQMVHAKGYVFRDISHINFIIDKSGKMYLLDPELSYSRTKQKPAPPFMLGTEGYYGKEQETELVPDYSQDIHALGKLLSFCVTGDNPKDMASGRNQLRKYLLSETNDQALVGIVLECTQDTPEARPKLGELIVMFTDLEEGKRISGMYKEAI